MINNYEKIPIGKARDLTNQKFGKLTVLYRVKTEKTGTFWLCECECGNTTVVSMGHLTSKHTTSCGCQKRLKQLDDLTGQRFGKLVVLTYDKVVGKGHTYWLCQCDCGTIKSIRKDGLINGSIVSCGCYQKQIISEKFTLDLTNQKFGHWTVLSRAGSNDFNVSLWLCECDCGVKKIVPSNALRNGDSQSCGCIKSRGQDKIAALLQQHNIDFTVEQTFSSCRFSDTNHLAKFDFYVNNTYLIEYDGIQHYQAGTGWNTQEKFLKTQKHDLYKNNWCKENNITLIRIPYYHLDSIKINDLIPDTSAFIVSN